MDYQGEQNDEKEALQAIFEDDFTDLATTPCSFMLKLKDLDVQLSGPLYVKITYRERYPDEVPDVEIPLRSQVLTTQQHTDLLDHLKTIAEESVGMAMVFTLVEAARDWINQNVCPDTADEEEPQDQTEEEPSDVLDLLSSPAELTEVRNTGGRWNFVIGLVGKPSAGKSTFFNAAMAQNQAKTAAHPFTTIEPNFGTAYFSVPCPCAKMDQQCSAGYGHNYRGERLLPVLLKDVAGLVPGAADGKGRGNRFLNDLLDAESDVLIHIIDVSGQTDENGEETTGYDPTNDVRWLNLEIHRWIYDNIMTKWEAIVKRPLKLLDMFTGYHASRSVIQAAFTAAGIDTRKLVETLPGWDVGVVHRLVTEFIRLRFPMVLGLNKSDLPQADNNIHRIQEAYPNAAVMAMSAQSECKLQELQKTGSLHYRYGEPSFMSDDTTLKPLSSTDTEELDRIQNSVLSKHGSTNVHNALNLAVSLKSPIFAFPVQDLDTLMSLDHRQKGEAPGVLKDCMVLRPGTTVGHLHTVLVHALELLKGTFVRAEAREINGDRRVVRKDEIIGPSNNVIKIMTSPKSSHS
ncbi:PREDICTED: uncharacterized GTP-binding protein YGR210C-like [Branchiostoma belcheri]|uniref:Uncharacterized GTP-binding protein YGR210C-like n=1 Tax=Branchiostoma belcheri TaxID=7741 RepID=A0A6P4YJV2_BRABE|nr:PREDICTED: uncharacterized GTP-binding protein YGR210C-like [Branchiostoma belcheri]